ncbi:MAG TPA: Clp1/GlmU family protein [Candidatus Limnocylindrales bacterium]|nr:Clp1/GlmU family protein [Candidatus Limnocylindrales bacterium]
MSKPVALDLEQGHTLLLKGPAWIRAKGGDAQCLGARIQSDDWTMIEGSRQEPIYAADDTLLEIRRGAGSSLSVVGESTVPVAWKEAAQVLQRQRGVCVIIGEVDSGKSSLCTFLANKCLEDTGKVGVVDADVGQADIGPPTTISSSVVQAPIIGLHKVAAEISFFIGDTSPSFVPDKVVALATRLKRRMTRSADTVLVNTDGWLTEFNALRHKQLLLEEIQPDLVIRLSRSDEVIDPLLDRVKFASLKLPTSPFARIRSKEERKKAREAGYRRFLQGSQKLGISQETRVRLFDQLQQTVFPEDRRLRGLVAGLLNQNEELLSIGRISQVGNGRVIVETKTIEKPTILEIGNIALSSRYDEVGYGTLH